MKAFRQAHMRIGEAKGHRCLDDSPGGEGSTLQRNLEHEQRHAQVDGVVRFFGEVGAMDHRDLQLTDVAV